MLHEPIQQQLGRLGLRGAADALARLPLNDDVIDALAILLQAECLHRDSLAQSRRTKLAKLGQRAHPADVDLRSARDIGKSYLACALAKAAIDAKQSVRYLRLPRLGEELAALQAQGRIGHWLKALGRIDLIILDDFGLVPMSPSHQPLLLELLEDRYQRGSVLVTSQLPTKLWHGQFQDPTLADAILDRLVHNAELIELTGESMRKRNQRSAEGASDKSEPPI